MEVLGEPEIDAPGSRSAQVAPWGVAGIVESLRADDGKSESGPVPGRVSGSAIRVPRDSRAIATAKSAFSDGVRRTGRDIAQSHRTATVTFPPRRVARARFREH